MRGAAWSFGKRLPRLLFLPFRPLDSNTPKHTTQLIMSGDPFTMPTKTSGRVILVAKIVAKGCHHEPHSRALESR